MALAFGLKLPPPEITARYNIAPTQQVPIIRLGMVASASWRRIPASGYYEWQKREDGTKQPMHIGMKDGAPFAFAGLWTTRRPKDAELVTCTIITGEPNELAGPIHNRMPVILAPSDYERWLSL